MVQIKKSGTMAWLMNQDDEKQDKIINLARTGAQRVQEEREEHRLYRKRQRQAEVEKSASCSAGEGDQ